MEVEPHQPTGVVVTPIAFSWENLSYEVQTSNGAKTILYPTTGTARPGRVLAIMGPSGAGKTTFINACIGRLPKDDATLGGCCLVNDVVYGPKYGRLVSIVTQDDIVMGKDTPREALYFSLRIRRNISADEATAQVNDALERLNLTSCSDTLIGLAGLIKGISGGEKKRVNIGTELIVNPPVMILDEPTTGLDSVNAANVGSLLRGLAKDGRTVMCTIHSPSSDLFELFDDIMLMSNGHVVFHGDVADCAKFFADNGYPVPPRTNPSEHYMRILQMSKEAVDPLWVNFERINQKVCSASLARDMRSRDDVLDQLCVGDRSSSFTQFWLLLARAWRQNIRNPSTTIVRLILSLFFGILFGLFFFDVYTTNFSYQNLNGALFVLMINTVFGSTMPGVVSFPPERAVFLREQASDMYGVVPYFASKLIVDIPMSVPYTTLFIIIVYFMIHLTFTPAAFFIFYLLVVETSICSYSLGLAASAFFPRAEIALALIPVIFLPTMLVGGLFSNTERLVPYWEWLGYISIPRYAYMGLVVNQYRSMDTTCPNPGPCPIANGEAALRLLGFSDWTWQQSAWILPIFAGGLWVIACVSLWLNARKFKPQVDFHAYLSTRTSIKSSSLESHNPIQEAVVAVTPMNLEQHQVTTNV